MRQEFRRHGADVEVGAKLAARLALLKRGAQTREGAEPQLAEVVGDGRVFAGASQHSRRDHAAGGTAGLGVKARPRLEEAFNSGRYIRRFGERLR